MEPPIRQQKLNFTNHFTSQTASLLILANPPAERNTLCIQVRSATIFRDTNIL